MSTTARFLGLGIALGLAAGMLVGVGLTPPGRAAATTPSAAPRIATSGGAAIAPLTTTVTSGGSTSTAVASSGTAIAYPYYPGPSGIAPDHTIVVTGVGQAAMQSGGSDRASAQKSALAAALGDAKVQATEIASATGLTISGVLSVSASVGPNYGIVPMAANGSSSGSASGEPTCVIAMPGSGPSASAGIVPPVPACVPVTSPPYQQILSVSVTVEYAVR